MAIHQDTASMLKESVKEALFVAEFCTKYSKDLAWGQEQINGCLGYPSAIMLFCIIDTIGSFYEGNMAFKININRKDKTINNDGFEHFYILNSNYYNQDLGETIIKQIYKGFRSLLIHNLSLPPNHILAIGRSSDKPFELTSAIFHEGKRPKYSKIIRPGLHLSEVQVRKIIKVNLIPLLEISKHAVKLFIESVDDIIPNSKQNWKIHSKRIN